MANNFEGTRNLDLRFRANLLDQSQLWSKSNKMSYRVWILILLLHTTQSYPSKKEDPNLEENDWRFSQNPEEIDPPTNQNSEQNLGTTTPSPPPTQLRNGSDENWNLTPTSNRTFLEQCWQAMEAVSSEISSWTEGEPGKEQLLIKRATHQVLTSNYFWALFLAIAGFFLSLTSQCTIAYCFRPKPIAPTIICRHKETPPADPTASLVQNQHTSQLHRLEQATSSLQQAIAKQGLAMQHFMREQFATIRPLSHQHQPLLDASSIASTSTATLTTVDIQPPASEFDPHSLRRSKSVKMVPPPQAPRKKIDLADFEDSSDCDSQYEINREQMATALGAIPKLKTQFLPNRRPAPTPPQPASTFTRQNGGGLRSSIRGSKRQQQKYDDNTKYM